MKAPPMPVNGSRRNAVVKGVVLSQSLRHTKLGKQKNTGHSGKNIYRKGRKSNHNFPHFSAMNSIDNQLSYVSVGRLEGGNGMCVVGQGRKGGKSSSFPKVGSQQVRLETETSR